MGIFRRKSPPPPKAEEVQLPVLRIYQGPKAQGLPLPSYAKEGDVGMDVPVAVGVDIPPHGYAQVETDLRFIIPEGYYLHVYDKGSSAVLGLSFDLSIVDRGYTGKLTLVCWNQSGVLVHVPRGKCIAQIVLRSYEQATLLPISLEEIDAHKTDRGDGRLGSSRTGI